MNTTVLHILHADDDPEDRMFFQEGMLACDPSIQLTQFENGIELLSFLKKNDPSHYPVCAIVCDMKMPMIDGIDVLKIIRANEDWHKTPVVILSTSSYKNDISTAIAFGANAFFSKPSTMAENESILSKIVAICFHPAPPAREKR